MSRREPIGRWIVAALVAGVPPLVVWSGGCGNCSDSYGYATCPEPVPVSVMIDPQPEPCELDGSDTADGGLPQCADLLRVRVALVGTWIGAEVNPFGQAFQVQITFGSDGHYTGHCAQSSCPTSVFYWGTDDDSPLKTYEVTGLNTTYGWAVGHLAVVVQDNETMSTDPAFMLPVAQHLQFHIWADTDMPMLFDLTRAP
ncbi:MAG TPA: hypothetical protein VKQ32_19085 [Polyangia bacterium]|nr:hypothetical protein [Polyangia bacterium]